MSLAASFKPAFDRVLLYRPVVEAVSKGGVILGRTNGHSGALVKAKVVALGPGRWSRRTRSYLPIQTVKLHDEVLVSEYAGFKFADEEGYQLVKEHDILGVVTPSK